MDYELFETKSREAMTPIVVQQEADTQIIFSKYVKLHAELQKELDMLFEKNPDNIAEQVEAIYASEQQLREDMNQELLVLGEQVNVKLDEIASKIIAEIGK